MLSINSNTRALTLFLVKDIKASEPASSSRQLMWYDVCSGSHLPPVDRPWQWAPILDGKHRSLWPDILNVGAGLSHSMLWGCLSTTVPLECTLSLDELEPCKIFEIWEQHSLLAGDIDSERVPERRSVWMRTGGPGILTILLRSDWGY